MEERRHRGRAPCSCATSPPASAAPRRARRRWSARTSTSPRAPTRRASSPGCCRRPRCLDSDCDGLSDSAELGLGSNPADADSDHDGLSDGAEEFTYHTNLLDADTDDDGASDGAEVTAGTDPREPTSVPPPPLPVPALPPSAGLVLAGLLLATALASLRRARSS